ncbi:MAG: hypothetical protein NT085_04570 [candidate division SR1 bacterium]|nr:hypothetical protein [candidate division SR1 bacterium]
MARQIIIGLVIAGLGGSIVYFSGYLADIFGNIAWFDKNLGGTRNGFIISGFAIMIIGFLILFGVIPTSSPTENIGGFTTTSTSVLPN